MSLDRRRHARVAVPIDARVVTADQEIPLTIRELSRSGIFLYSQKVLGEPGNVIALKLAITAGIKPLHISGEIVRNATDDNGEPLGAGIRFVKVTPEQDKGLIDLLDRALLGRGTQMRAFPRVSSVSVVRCTSRAELGLVLRDIGEGGLGLEADKPFSKDEKIALEVSRPGTAPLKLTGWVVSCLPSGGNRRKFRVGVCFTALRPAQRKELVEFLRTLYRR